jgi:hypothetical protein
VSYQGPVAWGRRSGVFGMPSTHRGRQAVVVFATSVAAVVVSMLLAGLWFGLLEDAPDEQESPPVWMQVPMVAGVLVAFVSAFTGGVLAVIAARRGERSGLLLLPALVAVIAAGWLVGEFAVPH